MEEEDIISFSVSELQNILEKAEACVANFESCIGLMGKDNSIFTEDEIQEARLEMCVEQGKVELLQDLLGAEDE